MKMLQMGSRSKLDRGVDRTIPTNSLYILTSDYPWGGGDDVLQRRNNSGFNDVKPYLFEPRLKC